MQAEKCDTSREAAKETGKQYGIYCRKKGSLDANEEVLLDENELAKGHKYFRIGTLSVSRLRRRAVQ